MPVTMVVCRCLFSAVVNGIFFLCSVFFFTLYICVNFYGKMINRSKFQAPLIRIVSACCYTAARNDGVDHI